MSGSRSFRLICPKKCASFSSAWAASFGTRRRPASENGLFSSASLGKCSPRPAFLLQPTDDLRSRILGHAQRIDQRCVCHRLLVVEGSQRDPFRDRCSFRFQQLLKSAQHVVGNKSQPETEMGIERIGGLGFCHLISTETETCDIMVSVETCVKCFARWSFR